MTRRGRMRMSTIRASVPSMAAVFGSQGPTGSAAGAGDVTVALRLWRGSPGDHEPNGSSDHRFVCLQRLYLADVRRDQHGMHDLPVPRIEHDDGLE